VGVFGRKRPALIIVDILIRVYVALVGAIVFTFIFDYITAVIKTWLSLLRGRAQVPIATATDVPELVKLKSLPADPSIEGPNGEQGYVKLRRLTYGEKMAKRAMNSKMTVRSQKGRKDAESIIETFNERSDLYDFANVIVDHNLTDGQGRKLDFRNEKDVKSLSGQVAEEIQTAMDRINNFEDDEELGN
jgi:hypothetical protein